MHGTERPLQNRPHPPQLGFVVAGRYWSGQSSNASTLQTNALPRALSLEFHHRFHRANEATRAARSASNRDSETKMTQEMKLTQANPGHMFFAHGRES